LIPYVSGEGTSALILGQIMRHAYYTTIYTYLSREEL
jgi:hypothetical protein